MPQKETGLGIVQHDGNLTVLDGTFGAVTSKAPFLLYGMQVRGGVVTKKPSRCKLKVQICAKI
jgi:hypothetical protein